MTVKITPIRTTAIRFGTRQVKSTGQVFPVVDTKQDFTILSEVKSGVENPSYKVQIAQGSDAGTNYSRVGGSASTARFSGTWENAAERYNFFGSIHPPQPGSLLDTSDNQMLIDLALLRLKRKLTKSLGQAALAEPLAESKKLGGLIRQAASIGTDTLQELIKLRKNPGKRSLKSIGRFASGIWLAYGFGVKPVIKDIDNSVRAIQDYLDMSDHSVRVHAGSGASGQKGVKPSMSVSIGSIIILDGYDRAEFTQRYRFNAGASLKVGAGNSYGVHEHLGLGADAIVPLAWELTYASWMTDYFVNIGEFLEDSFFTLPGDLAYLNLNMHYEGKARRMFEKRKPPAGSVNRAIAGTATLEYYSFRRTKLASIPHGGLHMKSWDRQGEEAVTKLLNLAAFLGTKILR